MEGIYKGEGGEYNNKECNLNFAVLPVDGLNRDAV